MRAATALVVACLTLTGCSSGTGGGAGHPDARAPQADCAATVVYDGHTYWGHGELRREPATTGRLVEGVVPACDDTGGRLPLPPDEPVRLAELSGVPLETAVLLDGHLYVRDGRELPAAARPWFRAPRCESDGVFDLGGRWLGVTGPRPPEADGDLRVPYGIEVRVARGPEEYVGTTVALRADRATDPTLDARDVKNSLWRGGRVTARVTCDDGRFRALSLRVPRGG